MIPYWIYQTVYLSFLIGSNGQIEHLYVLAMGTYIATKLRRNMGAKKE